MDLTAKALTVKTLRPIGTLALCKVLPERFLRLIAVKEDGCWQWLGATRSRKYKHSRYRYGTYNGRYAHIRMYEAVNGPVPQGLEIDHLCHNKLCVNPEHLEAVTHKVNCARRKKSGPYPNPNSVRSQRGFYAGRYE